MLNDYDFQATYDKLNNDIAEEFYLPCMRESVRYDRITGYFGSTVYIIAWDALKEFMSNDGRMRIICSPVVSDEDAKALEEGYSARTDEILAAAIEKEVAGMLEKDYLTAPARLLAYLVTENIVDIKLAVPTSHASATVNRLFHDKVGIFTDAERNSVGFRGSMNETFQGLSPDGNIESIDVFPNWMDERDKIRDDEAIESFEKLWNKEQSGVNIYEFPDASRELMKRESNGVEWEKLLDEIKVTENLADKWKPNHSKDGRTPRDHQASALENWVKNGRRGILEHATGSGKTFTAMCAINKALLQHEAVIILVPSINLLTQWEEELRATLTDYEVHYLLCGDIHTGWKKDNRLQTYTAKVGTLNRIVIATMDTASSEAFMKGIVQGEHLFLVADEMHRLGSTQHRKFLNIQTGARLGLSATPRRYGDPDGTKALFDYFGGVIQPPYTLEDAMRDGVLSKYFYYPKTISLTTAEQEEWNKITKEIQKIIARMNVPEGESINVNSNPRLKHLLINRSRIVKNAAGKIELAIKILKEEYESGQKWIVYCDNREQMETVLHRALDEKLNAYAYYADMEGDRETTLDYFETNGGILVSIRCLDEGVDIPSTTHALILASSQNPREFIQRRGRILRKAAGKYFAKLYDAITVPFIGEEEDTNSLSIIATELSRAIQFGEGAENNASCIADLKNIAVSFHIDYETIKNGGIEDDD